MSIIEGEYCKKHLCWTICLIKHLFAVKSVRENLLKNVKKQVKQLMEVYVTRKFIHEDNSCIITLCGKIHSKVNGWINLLKP